MAKVGPTDFTVNTKNGVFLDTKNWVVEASPPYSDHAFPSNPRIIKGMRDKAFQGRNVPFMTIWS